MLKPILLFMLSSCILSAEYYDADEINSICAEGSSNNMASCYKKYYDKANLSIEKTINSIETTFVDSSLILNTQPLWKSYTEKWCNRTKSLNGNWGMMNYYGCIIEHTYKRIEELNFYYCDENGCPIKK